MRSLPQSHLKLFYHSILKSNDDSLFALGFVESIKLSNNTEELIIDKLKADTELHFVMLSGTVHKVSILKIQNSIEEYNDYSVEELVAGILEKWSKLIGDK